jgi:hypothetical protein
MMFDITDCVLVEKRCKLAILCVNCLAALGIQGSDFQQISLFEKVGVGS